MDSCPVAPSVGRIVHYHERTEDASDGSASYFTFAALVAHVPYGMPSVPDLVVFFRDGILIKRAVPYSSEIADRCWTWPPIVRSLSDLERDKVAQIVNDTKHRQEVMLSPDRRCPDPSCRVHGEEANRG